MKFYSLQLQNYKKNAKKNEKKKKKNYSHMQFIHIQQIITFKENWKGKKGEEEKKNKYGKKTVSSLEPFSCLTSTSFGLLVPYFSLHKTRYTTIAMALIILKIVIIQCLLFEIVFLQFP